MSVHYSFAIIALVLLASGTNAAFKDREVCGERCKFRDGKFVCKPWYCPKGEICLEEGKCPIIGGVCKISDEGICGTPSIRDDPHLVGFDGTRFGFHGVHDHHYVLFGRKGGDVVVGRMIATPKLNRDGVNATFFGEVGITFPGGNDRLQLSFESLTGDVGSESFVVRKNGVQILEGVDGPNFKVDINLVRKVTTVKTSDATYTLSAMKAGFPTHHFNLAMVLNRKPTSSDAYLGVLGATLNRKTGRDTELAFGASLRSMELENHLREMYAVESLFPEHLNDAEYDGDIATFKDDMQMNEMITAHSLEEEELM